jgi:hypothetical protein
MERASFGEADECWLRAADVPRRRRAGVGVIPVVRGVSCGHARFSHVSRSDPAVNWYHDTMTKNLTIRIPDDAVANAETIAREDGVSLNETVKQSLVEAVERRRNDPAFKAWLTKIIEEDRELLERLAK